MPSFQSWLAQPFSTDMSAGRWFLFFGLLLVIALLWHVLLTSVGVQVRGA